MDPTQPTLINQNPLLPVGGPSATAPEAYERAPTLMACAAPGGGGAVRVWAPSRRLAWSATVTSGSLGCLLLAVVYWFQSGGPLVLSVGFFSAMVYAIRALLRPCYITTDDAGMGITTAKGSRSFRWADVTRCDIRHAGAREATRLIFHVPERVEANLTGFSHKEVLELTDLVKAKADLVKDPNAKSSYYHVCASTIRSLPPGPPAVPVIVGIGVTFQRNGDTRLLVSAVEEHSPAGHAGLMVGDEVLAISHLAAETMDEESAAAECCGPEGALVDLRVSRELWTKELEFQVRMRRSFG